MRTVSPPALLLVALLAGIAATAPVAAQGRCDVRRELEGHLDAGSLRGVLIEAAAGALEVVGVEGGELRVRGVVCASDEGLAEEAGLRVSPRQDVAWVEASLPESRGRRDDYVRLDLVVEMPSRLAVDIRDGSGSAAVRGVAAARVEDGSGDIDVQEIAGAVQIDDSSGGIRVRDVGSVEIDDGSGEIAIDGVRGRVHILEDGSGSMEIRDVTGDVRIDEDGSGSIEVERVGGDFILEDDGSGSVRHRDVRGTVRVPPRR